MLERCEIRRLDVNGDAPQKEPVTLANHLRAPAELNSPAGSPLNSKRYQAVRSTAIERNPLPRSDRRPEEGERVGIQETELVPTHHERTVTPIEREVLVDPVLQVGSELGRTPREVEQLARQARARPSERWKEIQPDAIAKVGARAVCRILDERNTPHGRCCSDGRAGELDEWAADGRWRQNGREPARARAAKGAHDHGLDMIIEGVRGDEPRIEVSRNPG